MGLLNKIKNALFEEEEVEEEIAKKIDVEKTIKEEPEIRIRHYDEEKVEEPAVKENKTPMIFDVEDFVEEQSYEEPKKEYQKPVKTEQKIIYGGYVQDAKEHEKTKFKPSPVISPVYGILETKEVDDYKYETPRKSLDTMFTSEITKTTNLDEIRKKAFGIVENLPSEEVKPVEEKSLLYEMEDVDDKPGIEKLSIGDAVEYFEDLGLEYDVDYKDLAKEKMTRTKKNKELSEEVDEEIKENKKIEEELRKKSVPEVVEPEEVEEKNLYDLIDLMYDNKD